MCVIKANTVDLILSQAVLEHVEDLEKAYASMFLWLNNGGYISHEIDFKSHGTARDWDGHRCYSDFLWHLIRGRRAYFINREPLSSHVRNLQSSGFELKLLLKVGMSPGSPSRRLAPRFSQLDEDDLRASSAYVLACKKLVCQ